MTKRNLTAAMIDKLKPPASGQAEHFDAGFPGLACRVSHTGSRSWVHFYRVHGKLRRLTLGRWPVMTLAEAREAWRASRKAVERGEDPAAKKPSNEFSLVAAEWLARDQAENVTSGEVERVLKHDVLPMLQGRLITELTRRDLHRVIDAVADRGAMTMARRTHSHMNRLFRWAHGRGIIEANPMAGLPKPGKETSRDRVLSDDELVRVWRAAESMGWPFGPAVQLIILTLARIDEISDLRWAEICGDELVLARGDADRRKRKTPLGLSGPALAIIESLPRIGESEFVFTTTGRTAISGWSKAKRTLDARIGDMPAWRFHDLRRTGATGMQRLGVSLPVVEAVLGHVTGSRSGVVGIYQRHQYDDEQRQALKLWSAHVTGLAGGHPGKVIPMRAAKTPVAAGR